MNQTRPLPIEESPPISSSINAHGHKRRRYQSTSASKMAALTMSLLFMSQTVSTNGHQNQSQSPRPNIRTTTFPVLNTTLISNDSLLNDRSRWLRQTPTIARILDEGGNYYNDDAYQNDDVNSNNNGDDAAAAASDDAAAATDDYAKMTQYICEDKTCTINEQCTKFLFGFLEGTTDAKDNCEGIMNAYVAADCGTIRSKNSNKDTTIYADDDDFNDDYFGIFYDHQCCTSLRSHYYEYCDDRGMLNEYNLLVVAAVMLLCECAKSIIKKNNIRFLPEAAACMLVGMACALGASFFGTSIEQFSFDEEIFMYLLLPPIIFEAALSVNKREFRRRRGAIMVFAVLGTLMSSFITGTIVYYSAKYLGDQSLDILDSLVFGSLISSIDPVAILSVLTSINMSETDTIYILVFGESLLNDGVAITLFKSLIEHYHSDSTLSLDSILGSVADFLIIAFGSCGIGLACGVACLCYFHLNSSILHPVMEVASFFLWAVIPYWMAEAFEWSGIVSIVVMGFFMDIYLRPGWDPEDLQQEEEERQLMLAASKDQGLAAPGDYHNMDDDSTDPRKFRFRGTAVDIPRPNLNITRPNLSKSHSIHERDSVASLPRKTSDDPDLDGRSLAGTSMTTPNVKAILLKKETVRLSREADEHIHFVAHILSQMSENAIFAYLGLFLFSSKYEWDGILCSIGVASCVLSRAVMVVFCSSFIWHFHVFRQRAGCEKSKMHKCAVDEDDTNCGDGDKAKNIDPLNTPISKSARALSNGKVQVVLILAGLRGAVSLALVESIPIYNGVTGVGSQNKPLLKAMTSSSIIFTIFVLGGGAYYILQWLDISSEDMLIKSSGKQSNRDYLYPTIYCGYPSSEMELAPSPTFHERSSPRTRYLRDGYVVPGSSKHLEFPVPDRSLSIDTLVSDTEGLNPIIAAAESQVLNTITVTRSKDQQDSQRSTLV
eukprot:scaffold3950_cov175-Alexandrium_tamarense.AAC.1